MQSHSRPAPRGSLTLCIWHVRASLQVILCAYSSDDSFWHSSIVLILVNLISWGKRIRTSRYRRPFQSNDDALGCM